MVVERVGMFVIWNIVYNRKYINCDLIKFNIKFLGYFYVFKLSFFYNFRIYLESI